MSGKRKVAIIGTGLMGGSLGLALRASDLFDVVAGYDIEPGTSKKARERGAVTEVAASPGAASRGAAVVFIATPIGSIRAVFAEIAPALGEGTVVTDLGSTKGRVVEEITPMVPGHAHFIGGHPIAGAEQEGIEAAEPDLYRGCVWILTPTKATNAAAYGTLVRLIGSLDARVLSLDPARHDELVALTSHLPQLLSSSLMGFAAEIASAEGGLPLVGAGGFRDMTRIAASSPDMWVEIVRDNRQAVLDVLMGFESAIRSLSDSIGSQDWDSLRKLLVAARDARSTLPGKPGMAAADLVELLIAVPDRPGVLAEITTTVGEAGVNIEDIDIVHSPEGGRGTVHLAVNGHEASRIAEQAVALRGYKVTRAEPRESRL